MAREVIIPKLTHDMKTGVILEWYKEEGDSVRKGDPILAVETDKAAVDIEAEAAGRLQGRRFEVDVEVPVGEVVAWILSPGEDVPQIEPASGKPAGKRPTQADRGRPSEEPSPHAGGRIVASPLAKRVAETEGANLQQLAGSGPHGRILAEDVRAHLEQQQREREPEKHTAYEVVPLSKSQRRMGERMLASVRSAPHFDLEIQVDMYEAKRWRDRHMEGSEEYISYTAVLVKVVSKALAENPRLNSSFVEGELRKYQDVNIGVAVAISEELLVPVIHRADELTLHEIQAAITELRVKAERGRFSPAELKGGTFTVSNLGMYGIDAFRAIINPPEAAILAAGQIKERPVAVEGEIAVRPVMRAVLSVDHRAVDGAEAAGFLGSIQRYLQDPYHLL